MKFSYIQTTFIRLTIDQQWRQIAAKTGILLYAQQTKQGWKNGFEERTYGRSGSYEQMRYSNVMPPISKETRKVLVSNLVLILSWCATYNQCTYFGLCFWQGLKNEDFKDSFEVLKFVYRFCTFLSFEVFIFNIDPTHSRTPHRTHNYHKKFKNNMIPYTIITKYVTK